MKKIVFILGLLLGIQNTFGSIEEYFNDFAKQDLKVLNFELGFAANMVPCETIGQEVAAHCAGIILAAYFTAWHVDAFQDKYFPIVGKHFTTADAGGLSSTPIRYGDLTEPIVKSIISYLAGSVCGSLVRTGLKTVWNKVFPQKNEETQPQEPTTTEVIVNN